MNWAYGVEFLEIDPKQLGTDKFDDGEDKESQQQLQDVFSVDKDRVKALHGNAVLSRYPIRSARLAPFTIGYGSKKVRFGRWKKANAKPQYWLEKICSAKCAAASEPRCS